MKKVFTTGQVAKICHISITAVIRCFKRGLLKGFLVPGSNHRRITAESLKKFMQDNGLPLEFLENGQAGQNGQSEADISPS